MVDKIPVFDLAGSVVKEVEAPPIFKIGVREDIVRRVFVFQFTHRLQPKGRYPRAGRDKSAEFFGVGLGLARVPRIKHGPLRGTAAIVTMARGGRRPHVTTPEKKIYKRINRKEVKLATAYAVAATGVKELVAKRGHIIDNVLNIPLVVSDELETIGRTSVLMETFRILGLEPDILRVKENVKRRGGKSSWRGRGKRVRRGPLIVYSQDRGIFKAARNIIGVDVVSADDVSVIHLAPGGVPGRLTVWTESAINKVVERLYPHVKVLRVIGSG